MERLVVAFSRTWQRPPNPQELQGLIEEEIKSEVYYREALAMGLDRDDTTIHRRLRQKLEFLAEDMAAQEKSSDTQLQALLDQHPDKFRAEARVSFSQVCLNQSQRGASTAQDAQALLARLNGAAGRAGAAPLGDPILLPADNDSQPQSQVARLFGEGFAARLTEAPVGRWAGPIESGYGLHVVRVRDRAEAHARPLSEVRDAVEREWRAARREETNEAFYRRLRSKYAVTVELPALAGSTSIR